MAKQQEMYAQKLREEEAKKAADAEAKRLEMNARLSARRTKTSPRRGSYSNPPG